MILPQEMAEVTASLVIGRQPNFRSVNADKEFVNEDDPSAVGKKVDDPDSAVYILNEKLQVNYQKTADCKDK